MSRGFRRPSSKNANLVTVKEEKKEDYPKKDLGMLISLSKNVRKPSTEELLEQILNEFSISDRLRYAHPE